MGLTRLCLIYPCSFVGWCSITWPTHSSDNRTTGSALQLHIGISGYLPVYRLLHVKLDMDLYAVSHTSYYLLEKKNKIIDQLSYPLTSWPNRFKQVAGRTSDTHAANEGGIILPPIPKTQSSFRHCTEKTPSSFACFLSILRYTRLPSEKYVGKLTRQNSHHCTQTSLHLRHAYNAIMLECSDPIGPLLASNSWPWSVYP
ncbi:hypothetical protein BGZ63DRAFT_372645 [Mariannaea sp. PMI_226]|nr:hypothetical protein BGZ63DRAFT_372645 [Mariannaea sp. PMI_226]